MVDYITKKEVERATNKSGFDTRKTATDLFGKDKKMKRSDFEKGMREGKVSYETRKRIGGRINESSKAPDPGITQKKRTGIFGALFGSGPSRDESQRSGGESRSSARYSRSRDQISQELGRRSTDPKMVSDRGQASMDRSSDRSTTSQKTQVGGIRKLH